MKILRIVAILLFVFNLPFSANAQSLPDSISHKTGKLFLVTKNDGGEFIGKLISMDAREVTLDTKNIGQVSIPKHEIKSMKEVSETEVAPNGERKPIETFATRYFLTTNGLPLEKGQSYVLWNFWGPDMQFGVTKNFSIGVMTTWFAMPVIASAKYSMELGPNTHLAVGTLLGSGTWSMPHLGIALPFAALTFGDRRNNITFSGGYGAMWGYGTDGGRVLMSVAGMAKISKKASLVFDSFIMPGINGNDFLGLYMPGIRLQTAPNKAFQFGCAGISTYRGTSPMPMVQWFRML